MFILETLNFVVDILKVPSVLVGLIALIGLVAQKKAFSDVVKGTIKTILGFIVLGGGATVLVFNTAAIMAMLKQYREDRDFMYGLDIKFLDAARAARG